jgi:hypothetical protein
MYDNIALSTKNKRDLIVNYQYTLREIPLWNQALINTEVTKIQEKCEFLDDLVAAIFVTNVKILSSIKMGKDKQKIQVTMPKTDQFIHKIYTNAAQTLYNNPYIFSNQYDSQKRKSDIIVFVQNSIENTIRTNLPFRNILQNYLGNTTNEESDSESEESDNESTHDTNNELDNTNEINDENGENEFSSENVDENTGDSGDMHENFTNNEDITNHEQPKTEGFFDRPIEHQLPYEEKTVPIQNPPSNLQDMQSPQVPQQPMLFPDAAPDPEIDT